MEFQHSGDIWRDFPGLVPGVVFADGITHDVKVGDRTARFTAIARSRLDGAVESELPEIRAWRHAFARMGLKPTQYRCASEALLRRLRKEGTLPSLHPLVDICNAASAAFAIPVAVFDVSKLTGRLEVRYATGDEQYLTFSGQTEHPSPGEVIFADQAGQVHARRWTNRQSGLSAVQAPTAAALIVAEAMHDSASSDIPELIAAIAGELKAIWSITPAAAVLSQSEPRFASGDDDGLPAVPAVYRGTEGMPGPVLLTLDVDGERFAIRRAGDGGTAYDWLSGPNNGYGFGSIEAPNRSAEEHRESIRAFLAMIDPDTGYIGDD